MASNRAAAWAGSDASQGWIAAPSSLASPASLPVLRAAKPIRRPAPCSTRATDALSPSPAPTINARSYLGIMQHLSFSPALTQAPDRVRRPVGRNTPVNQSCLFGLIKKSKRLRKLPKRQVQSIWRDCDSEYLVWLG